MGAVYEKTPLKCTEISATKGIEYANKYFKSFKFFFCNLRIFTNKFKCLLWQPT